jgi:hypothetical protein
VTLASNRRKEDRNPCKHPVVCMRDPLMMIVERLLISLGVFQTVVMTKPAPARSVPANFAHQHLR